MASAGQWRLQPLCYISGLIHAFIENAKSQRWMIVTTRQHYETNIRVLLELKYVGKSDSKYISYILFNILTKHT